MSFDPNETRVMPWAANEFPTTDELPAVVGRRRGTPPWLTAALLVGLLVAAGAVLVVALVLDNRSDTAATATPTTGTGEPTAPPVFVEPSAVVTTGEPGYWQIVGVDDGLNVRSGPGTNNEVVGALAVGTRHVFSTGEQAAVNGATWQRITFGDDDRTGWVSARFLASDTAPDPNATPVPTATPAPSGSVSVVCFQAPRDRAHIARIVFTSRTQISGFVERDDGQGPTRHSVEGDLDSGTAALTFTNQVTGETSSQRWTFNPATVVTNNGTSLSVVSCSSLGLN